MEISEQNKPFLLKKIKNICKIYNIKIPFDNINLKINYLTKYNAIIHLNITDTICITWTYTYRTIERTYYKNEKIHNVNGPAIFLKNNNEEIIVNYINGTYITKEILEQYPDILTNKLLQKILF